MIISYVKAGGNVVDATRVQSHVGFLEDYIASLQDEGLSTSRVHAVVSTSGPPTESTAST